jgi:signal transduction histidine kinase/ActR/RegA family two-component response regulator
MTSYQRLSKTEPGKLDLDHQTSKIFLNTFAFYGTLDTQGRVLDLEGAIFKKTHKNPTLLIGQRFPETVFWQSSENTPKNLDKAIRKSAQGHKSKILLDFRISADKKIAVELFLHPLEDHGETKRIFFCAQEIAGREDQLEHHKQHSEQLLSAAENAEIGLWFWDLAENKLYSTPTCNDLFEVPAYDILTYDSFLASVHADDRERIEAALKYSQQNGTKYNEEYRVVYSDGRIEWISSEGRSFLDENGAPREMMGTFRKITEQKLAAEELSKVYDREKKARDEAVEANRAKDFFLAFVSHELRSPLNAILGWAKILLTKTVDDATRKNALETIERSARVQTKLINDLVDSARVASGKLRLEFRPTNVYEIVRTTCHSQKPSADVRNITFELTFDDNEISVFGDSGRLQQVFNNLISNAIKFTPEGGTVSVDVKKSADAAVVTVKDTGQGIHPDVLPTIFRQFSQGDKEGSHDRSGLGLGLSIVKILIGKHGGTVRAESEGMGHGSTFTVTLPLSDGNTKLRPEPAETPAAEEKLLRGVTILLVEDDADSREVTELFLQQCGAVVRSAESARVAMALLVSGEHLPDVIVSDLAMPDEDGYSLIRRIRELPAANGGEVPTLALSAFATNESRQKAFAAGFDRYRTKPFEPDLLVEDILELVKK